MSSADDAVETMIRNLEKNTGKSMEQWVRVAKKSGSAKHGEIVKHLKTEGLTYGYANLVAHTTLQSASVHQDSDDLVESQYAGAKAALRPIYDQLMKKVSAFGNDIEVSPKKAYVSLRRKKQFAIIQPGTATRLDVGLNLKDAKTTERLEISGSFNSMVSHRVRVTSLADVDDELVKWLRKAYEGA